MVKVKSDLRNVSAENDDREVGLTSVICVISDKGLASPLVGRKHKKSTLLNKIPS